MTEEVERKRFLRCLEKGWIGIVKELPWKVGDASKLHLKLLFVSNF